MADNSNWTNSKGKIFTGQVGSVPAADDKSPVVVDYEEWRTISVVATQVGAAPSEAANSATQAVACRVFARTASQNPLASWTFDISYQNGGGSVPVTFANVAQIPGGITLDVVFPIAVVEGQAGIINFRTADHTATLTITVAA
jgi:hypothetical protein